MATEGGVRSFGQCGERSRMLHPWYFRSPFRSTPQCISGTTLWQFLVMWPFCSIHLLQKVCFSSLALDHPYTEGLSSPGLLFIPFGPSLQSMKLSKRAQSRFSRRKWTRFDFSGPILQMLASGGGIFLFMYIPQLVCVPAGMPGVGSKHPGMTVSLSVISK